MKKAIKLFLRFVILVGLLLPVSGVGPPARAANGLQKRGGNIGWNIHTRPPDKMCKDDTPLIVIGYIPEGAEPFEILGTTTAGTLSKSYWPFPAGSIVGVAITMLTAKNLGEREIKFETMTDPLSSLFHVEVVDCDYELRLEASERQKNDLVNFYMSVEGKVLLSSQDMRSIEDGQYSLFFNGEIQDEELKSGSEGLACALEEASSSFGDTFDVTGTKFKDNITLSVQFKETEFGQGVILHCLDKNGQESYVSMFENQTVNPGDSIPLSPNFSRGVSTYKFQFGESGSGTYTLIKRNKK